MIPSNSPLSGSLKAMFISSYNLRNDNNRISWLTPATFNIIQQQKNSIQFHWPCQDTHSKCTFRPNVMFHCLTTPRLDSHQVAAANNFIFHHDYHDNYRPSQGNHQTALYHYACWMQSVLRSGIYRTASWFWCLEWETLDCQPQHDYLMKSDKGWTTSIGRNLFLLLIRSLSLTLPPHTRNYISITPSLTTT